ncbi:MAG: hypothetical protein L3J11_11200 [Draconibacterium sp.]|nr:hypothetical protein [Draconibacterium sp.]
MGTKVLLFVVIAFFTLSCEKDEDTYIKPLKEINACGYDDPLNQLEWLHEIAYKSLNDKTGNYIGSIWIITHENKDIIVTDMALGSGGIYRYLFDCYGNQISTVAGLEPSEIGNYLTDSNMIFSTVFYQ